MCKTCGVSKIKFKYLYSDLIEETEALNALSFTRVICFINREIIGVTNIERIVEKFNRTACERYNNLEMHGIFT